MAMAGEGADQVVEGGAARGALGQAIDLALQGAQRQGVGSTPGCVRRGRSDEEIHRPRSAWPGRPCRCRRCGGDDDHWPLKSRARISFSRSCPRCPAWRDRAGPRRPRRRRISAAMAVAVLRVGDGEAFTFQGPLDEIAFASGRHRRPGPFCQQEVTRSTGPDRAGPGFLVSV